MSSRQFLVVMNHGPARDYGSLAAFAVHAIGHARDRLLSTCEAISWVAGLAHQWRQPRMPLFTIVGARLQDGTAGAGQQAAHLLPGQLLIDGREPWMLDRRAAYEHRWQARFAVTSAVPIDFNTADSAAEKAGLKEAFRKASERGWAHAIAGERDLTPIYKEFLEEADRAFLGGQVAKREKEARAQTRGRVAASESRLVEAVVLRMYLEHGVTAREASRHFPMPSPRA
jgi:hypothetical protein